MKNNQFIFVVGLFFSFLYACNNQESDKHKQSDKKLQSLLEDYMPKSKEEIKGSYKSVAKPNFSAIKDTKAKKQAFVNFMLPMIRESNRLILEDRKQLIRALAKVENNQEPLKKPELLTLCNRYTKACDKGSGKDKLTELLKRINIVPASLVLSQAANESAWGTSRFAVKANNFFGQWCFSKGCGLVPAKRGKNQTHEVRKFSSPLASVTSYMRNINTGHAYTQLRETRANLLAQKKSINGQALASGLMKYSERGQDYIDEVRQMIRYNQFDRYDLY